MSRKSELIAFPGEDFAHELQADNAVILEYPVLVTKAEFEAILKRGKTLCLHKWVYRKARDVGGFRIIMSDDQISECNIPAGRYCKKCGKIEWCRAKEESSPWSQLDFTPKR